MTTSERRIGGAALVAAAFAAAAAVGEVLHEQNEGDFTTAADYVEEGLFLGMCVAGAVALGLFADTIRASDRAGAHFAAAGFALLAASSLLSLALGRVDGPHDILFFVGVAVVVLGLALASVGVLRERVRPRLFPPALLVASVLSVPLVDVGGPALVAGAWTLLAAAALGRRGLPPPAG